MNKNKWMLLSLPALLCLCNCQKDCLDDHSPVDFNQVNINCCLLDTSFVINDDSTYQSQLNATDLPGIDFSRFTLIGQYFKGQCSETCYEIKRMCQNTGNNEITIFIKHKSSGLNIKCGCKKSFSTIYWLTILKISNDPFIRIQEE